LESSADFVAHSNNPRLDQQHYSDMHYSVDMNPNNMYYDEFANSEMQARNGPWGKKTSQNPIAVIGEDEPSMPQFAVLNAPSEQNIMMSPST
jgi:hypothetical protein